jgi:hypothetical protein
MHFLKLSIHKNYYILHICAGKLEETEFQLIIIEVGHFIYKVSRKLSLKFCIVVINIQRKQKVNFAKNFAAKTKVKTFRPTPIPDPL